MIGHDAAGRIATAFGLGGGARLYGPVDHGRHGEIWMLTTNDGRYAVKFLHEPGSPDAALRDAAFQDAVRASGVPTPAVFRTPGGDVLIELEGRHLRVYEWVDVLAPDRHLDPVEVGKLLATVHQVEAPAEGKVRDWFVAPVGEQAWSEVVAQLRAKDAPFVDRVAALVPQFLALEEKFEEPDTIRTCHCDLWVDNLRRTPDGRLVVLDWENCGPESPSQELGMVVFEYGLGEPRRMLDLYAAYLFAGGPGRLGRCADFTMLGAACEHLAEEGCRTWLAATSMQDKAAGASLVEWLLDEPVTLAVVDEVLEAVAGVSA